MVEVLEEQIIKLTKQYILYIILLYNSVYSNTKSFNTFLEKDSEYVEYKNIILIESKAHEIYDDEKKENEEEKEDNTGDELNDFYSKFVHYLVLKR